MTACRWMFMIFVGCRLFHTTQAQSTCSCDDQLKTLCVPLGEIVEVPCPKQSDEDVLLVFHRGKEAIHRCNYMKNATSCEPLHKGVGVKVHENAENMLSFVLTGVNASSHGVYRCEATLMYPPPIRVQSASMVLVLIEGQQCKINKGCDSPKTSGDQRWIWILVLVLLILYGLILTIIALANWIKLRKMDSHSDYINTKPRAPRDGRRKRGVQNPIPKHF